MGTPDSGGSGAPPFDLSEMLDRFGGDEALVAEVARVFLEDHAASLARVREAVAARDGEGIHRAAHALKGAVANLGAADATRAAQGLERIGRGGDLAGAEAGLRRLEAEVTRLVAALAPFGS